MGALNEYGSIQFNNPRISRSLIHSVGGGHRKALVGTDHRGLIRDSNSSSIEKRFHGKTTRKSGGAPENRGRADNVIDISIDSDSGDYCGMDGDGERMALESGARDNLVGENAGGKKDGDEVSFTAIDSDGGSAEVERGRLRCLIELGHLDAVVDQVRSCRW
jgi:hypothetical protein